MLFSLGFDGVFQILHHIIHGDLGFRFIWPLLLPIIVEHINRC